MNYRAFYVSLVRESRAGLATRWRIKAYIPASDKKASQAVSISGQLCSAAIGVVRQVGIQVIIYNQAGNTQVLTEESRNAVELWANAASGSLIVGVTDLDGG